ncbi:HNH endonuclease [Streptomyces sp. NPDC059757]|uniref:HNH endonuclease n=1 Tax=Streptomyces sp. NPDC059757 TaxID=3346935 RepID=UPI00364CA2D3
MGEYDRVGRDAFLADHDFRESRQFYVQHNDKLYDAKAIANVAYRYEHGAPPNPPISGGRADANRRLSALGFTIVDFNPGTVDGERAWRGAMWSHWQAQKDGGDRVPPPQALLDFAACGEGQGVWLDEAMAAAIRNAGLAKGVLDTGSHRLDLLTEQSALYGYPRTDGRQVDSEIDAMKAAAELRLPIFVLVAPTPCPEGRVARLAWVEGWDDQSNMFLLSFDDSPPEQMLNKDHSDEEPFTLTGSRSHHELRSVRVRPEQSRFKLRVFQRYSPRCPLSGVSIPEMLDAAHLRPVADDGTNDPRNGIPLNAALHRAFDAHLFAFHPTTFEVVTRPEGPTPAQLGISTPNLRGLARQPHEEAVRWRYDEWRRQTGGTSSLPRPEEAGHIAT